MTTTETFLLPIGTDEHSIKHILLGVCQARMQVPKLDYGITVIDDVTYSVVYDSDNHTMLVQSTKTVKTPGTIWGEHISTEVSSTKLLGISCDMPYQMVPKSVACVTCTDYAKVSLELETVKEQLADALSRCVTDEEVRLLAARKNKQKPHQ